LNFLKELDLNKLGILDWGYTENSTPSSYQHFENYINNQWNGSMSYLSDHRKDIRKDIKNFYPDFDSALVFLFSYQETKKAMDLIYKEAEVDQRLASYTLAFLGLDYHMVIGERLKIISDFLKNKITTLETREVLDIHPVLERDLAYNAGLGWFGKNSMLINKKYGSYFLIGSLLLSQKIDMPKAELENDRCGNCKKCLSACPTNALIENERTMHATQCISTFTIEENKGDNPPKGYNKVTQIFGCDICQEVCPWNEKAMKELKAEELKGEKANSLVDFFINRSVKDIIEELKKMSNGEFKKKFHGTSFFRSGKKGILKNLFPFL